MICSPFSTRIFKMERMCSHYPEYPGNPCLFSFPYNRLYSNRALPKEFHPFHCSSPKLWRAGGAFDGFLGGQAVASTKPLAITSAQQITPTAPTKVHLLANFIRQPPTSCFDLPSSLHPFPTLPPGGAYPRRWRPPAGNRDRVWPRLCRTSAPLKVAGPRSG